MNELIFAKTMAVADWPTQQQDLATAGDIINRHLLLNDGEPLGLVEVIINKTKENPLEFRMPAWVEELITHFKEQYGTEQGQLVASKVITRILLKDETIH